jgi:hypothetical protein
MPFSEVDEEALPLDSPWPESVGSGAVDGKLRLQAPSSLGRDPHAGLVGPRDSGCLSRSRCFPTLQMAFTGVAPG